MLKAAISELEGSRILTIENELPKPSFTHQTIKYLKETHPGKEFFYCMGQDSLAQFHTWKHHNKILEDVELIVAHRPGESHDDVSGDILSKSRFVDHSPVEASSSAIREKISNGEPVTDLLPEAVLDIIEKEQLYR